MKAFRRALDGQHEIHAVVDRARINRLRALDDTVDHFQKLAELAGRPLPVLRFNIQLLIEVREEDPRGFQARTQRPFCERAEVFADGGENVFCRFGLSVVHAG